MVWGKIDVFSSHARYKKIQQIHRFCCSSYIPLPNGKFTWSNFRPNPTITLIENFLISDSIHNKFVSATARRLERVTSDHYPIFLTLGKEKWGPSPFRFINAWLSHLSFLHTVDSWWMARPCQGWLGHGFIQKLKGLKKGLKIWNKQTFVQQKEKKITLGRELAIIDK